MNEESSIRPNQLNKAKHEAVIAFFTANRPKSVN